MDQFGDIKRMANQIARAFATYPEEEAVAETAKHIRAYWDPRMRKQLAEVMAKESDTLSPIALAAGRKLGLG